MWSHCGALRCFAALTLGVVSGCGGGGGFTVSSSGRNSPPPGSGPVVSFVSVDVAGNRPKRLEAAEPVADDRIDVQILGTCDPGCPGGASWTQETKRDWLPQLHQLPVAVSEEPIRLVIVATPTTKGFDELAAGRCLFVGGIKVRFDRGGERTVGSEGQPVLVLRPQNGKPCL